jgi:hypothetical protein
MGYHRAWEILIKVLSDEVEECGQLSLPGRFSCLSRPLIDLGEKDLT